MAKKKKPKRYRGNRALVTIDEHTLDRLYLVIDSRKGADPETSYTARLFSRGRQQIAKKLGEEAVEALIEGIRGDKPKLVAESADMLYHLLTLRGRGRREAEGGGGRAGPPRRACPASPRRRHASANSPVVLSEAEGTQRSDQRTPWRTRIFARSG